MYSHKNHSFTVPHFTVATNTNILKLDMYLKLLLFRNLADVCVCMYVYV